VEVDLGAAAGAFGELPREVAAEPDLVRQHAVAHRDPVADDEHPVGVIPRGVHVRLVLCPGQPPPGLRGTREPDARERGDHGVGDAAHKSPLRSVTAPLPEDVRRRDQWRRGQSTSVPQMEDKGWTSQEVRRAAPR
jgi:hypothetical protein